MARDTVVTVLAMGPATTAEDINLQWIKAQKSSRPWSKTLFKVLATDCSILNRETAKRHNIGSGNFDTQIKNKVTQIRSNVGNIVLSFGGANGQELAQVITDDAASNSCGLNEKGAS
jgi:hypothetical protein